MSVYLYQGSRPSLSAKHLARALKIRRIKTDNYSQPPGCFVINWGVSNALMTPQNCLNYPPNISIAANKRLFFRAFSTKEETYGRLPAFTELPADAKDWVRQGKLVVAREKLTGHSGEGIVLYGGDPDTVRPALLYVEYIKKAAEYRVHLFQKDGEITDFFIQRKARNREVEVPNWKIRNRNGGFIYANDPSNVGDVPEDVIVQAEKLFLGTGLDFGAVDVIWNKKQKKAYVLEVNTAPGLQGRTLEFYTNALKKLIG